jgi:hypothetical protein
MIICMNKNVFPKRCRSSWKTNRILKRLNRTHEKAFVREFIWIRYLGCLSLPFLSHHFSKFSSHWTQHKILSLIHRRFVFFLIVTIFPWTLVWYLNVIHRSFFNLLYNIVLHLLMSTSIQISSQSQFFNRRPRLRTFTLTAYGSTLHNRLHRGMPHWLTIMFRNSPIISCTNSGVQ